MSGKLGGGVSREVVREVPVKFYLARGKKITEASLTTSPINFPASFGGRLRNFFRNKNSVTFNTRNTNLKAKGSGRCNMGWGRSDFRIGCARAVQFSRYEQEGSTLGTGNRASRAHNATTRTTWVANHRDRFSFPRATFCPLDATPVDRRFFEIGVLTTPRARARETIRRAEPAQASPACVFGTTRTRGR